MTDLDSTGTTVTNSFSGQIRVSGSLDGVLKWAPNGNPTYNNFKLQGEYFRRSENGNLTYDTQAASLGTQTGELPARASRAGTCRACTSSFRNGASATATTG